MQNGLHCNKPFISKKLHDGVTIIYKEQIYVNSLTYITGIRSLLWTGPAYSGHQR